MSPFYRPRKRKKERKGGAAAPVGTAASRVPGAGIPGAGAPAISSSPEVLSGLSRGPLASFFGRGGVTLSRSLAGPVMSALRSPLFVGLLAGATAVGGGYGVVSMFSSGDEDVAPTGSYAPRHGASPGASVGRDTVQEDSIGVFAGANRGALGSGRPEGDEVGEFNDAAGGEVPEGEGPEGEEGEGGPEGKESLMQRLTETMEKDKSDLEAGKLARLKSIGSLGGSAQTSASLAAPGALGAAGAAAGKGGGKGSSARKMSARSVRMGRTGAGRRVGARSALQQAHSADKDGKQALGQGETGKFTAGKTFDGGIGAGGSPIDGAGAGVGEGSVGSGEPGANPPATGGPTGGPTNTGDNPDKTEEPPPDIPEPKNVTPWQDIVKFANMFITIASVLLGIAFLLGQIKNPYTYAAAKWLAYAAMAFAALAALAGVMIMAYGQALQGGIYTVAGTLLAVLAKTAAEAMDKRAAAAKQAALDKTDPEVWEAHTKLGAEHSSQLGEYGQGLSPGQSVTGSNGNVIGKDALGRVFKVEGGMKSYLQPGGGWGTPYRVLPAGVGAA